MLAQWRNWAAVLALLATLPWPVRTSSVHNPARVSDDHRQVDATLGDPAPALAPLVSERKPLGPGERSSIEGDTPVLPTASASVRRQLPLRAAASAAADAGIYQPTRASLCTYLI